MPSFCKFAQDTGRSPTGIGTRDLPDQRLDFLWHRRLAGLGTPTELGLVIPKLLALPGRHGGGLHKDLDFSPPRPATQDPRPKNTVGWLEAKLAHGSPVHGELMPQGDDLE